MTKQLDNYFYIPKTVIYSNLSNAAKLIYIHIFKSSGWEGIEFRMPTNANLSKLLKLGKNTVSPAVQELLDNGYIQLDEDKIVTLYYPTVDNKMELFTSNDRQNLKVSADVSKMGGITKICVATLYDENLKSNLKTTLFSITAACLTPKGEQLIKVEHLSRIAKRSNLPVEQFKKNWNKLKEAGYITFDVIQLDDEQRRGIVNLKVYNRPETVIIPKVDLTQLEMLPSAEEEIKDMIDDKDDEITMEEMTKEMEKDLEKEDFSMIGKINKEKDLEKKLVLILKDFGITDFNSCAERNDIVRTINLDILRYNTPYTKAYRDLMKNKIDNIREKYSNNITYTKEETFNNNPQEDIDSLLALI